MCAQARCAYCHRYGPLGQCQGCGAPNEPAQGPTGVITSSRALSEHQIRAIEKAWEIAYSGPGNVGKVAVLGEGISWIEGICSKR